MRAYQNYEREDVETKSIKYQFMLGKLQQYGFIDEEHGLLAIEKIKEICESICKE